MSGYTMHGSDSYDDGRVVMHFAAGDAELDDPNYSITVSD